MEKSINELILEMQLKVENLRLLQAQKSENISVLEEIRRMEDGHEVYKMIGKVLCLQERKEAEGNVEKRLEFIKNEEKRTEDLIKETEKELETLKTALMRVEPPPTPVL